MSIARRILGAIALIGLVALLACSPIGENVGGTLGSVDGQFVTEQRPSFSTGEYGNIYIVGQVKNVGPDIGYASVSCQVYKNDVQLATGFDNTSGLPSGRSWQYKALIIDELSSQSSYNIDCQAWGF